MSREIRRVPLDFDAPLGKTWHGYLMPTDLAPAPCGSCDNGITAARHWLHALSTELDSLGDDIRHQRQGRAPHPSLTDNLHAPIDLKHRTVQRPTPDILELLHGLTGEDEASYMRPMRGIDHGAIACKIIAAAGLDPMTWGVCADCGGRGVRDAYPGQEEDREAWQPTPPPTGSGWQIWQTVSEGGPVSPVFARRDQLAVWLSSPAAGKERISPEAAEAFTLDGWAPTGISLVQGGRAVHRKGTQLAHHFRSGQDG